jgi:FMN-dependent NADH-azoreductase
LVIAKDVIQKIGGDVVELELFKEGLKELDTERLKKRDLLLKKNALDDPMFFYAKQFAEADEIIIAAPFWDLSFPAVLKIYIENITVSGITFQYIDGRPIGLCRAKKLTYVTTSGGEIFEDFGYTYLRALAKNFYGIPEIVAVRAMNLDVMQIDAESVLKDADISMVY